MSFARKARKKALADELVRAVRAALAAGTRHFDVNGRLLTTEVEILTALRDDGEVKLAPREN